MQEPYLSVIIPTLNEEDYLPRLLKDLVSQKERSFEVIIVDGGSSDKTVKIASSFVHKLPLRIQKVSQKNVSFQRNSGARMAKGTYLVFFDADVQIANSFLYLLRKAVEKDKPAYVTTYVRADSVSVNDRVIAMVYNVGAEVSLLIDRPFVPGFNFTVRKNVFINTNGFREDIKIGEDYELATRLYRQGYRLLILKRPKLIFSLRRYRAEGSLSVFRKHALATLHVFTKGHITKNLFDYPMGGGWYRTVKTQGNHRNGFDKAQIYVRKFLKLLVE